MNVNLLVRQLKRIEINALKTLVVEELLNETALNRTALNSTL